MQKLTTVYQNPKWPTRQPHFQKCGRLLTQPPVADPAGAGGGTAPPRWRPEKFFCQYINIITKPTAYDGPWEY